MAKILVADDSFAVRQDLKRVLERAGHQVVLAEDGQSGLEAAKNEQPDLILSDFVMPRLTGPEMVRRLREEGVTTPIIIMSISADLDVIETALEAGADGFLCKNVKMREVFAAIDCQLAKKGAGDMGTGGTQ